MIGGPWYNMYICTKLHGKLFERFIRNERTDRYNIMCSIDAYEEDHLSSNEDVISERFVHFHQNSTIEGLYSLGATINFIG